MLDINWMHDGGRERDDFCDVRIWSGDCEHTTSLYSGDKYLCDVCGTVRGLEHEVIPAALPYVSGDYKSLS